ncbi:MAG: hypothetical protein KAG66_19295 [Methylococcales bacterium]|nr:hypothetical protein [Methylococcales bacterium]
MMKDFDTFDAETPLQHERSQDGWFVRLYHQRGARRVDIGVVHNHGEGLLFKPHENRSYTVNDLRQIMVYITGIDANEVGRAHVRRK